MSLYDESIEIVEYQQMLSDIKRNRETMAQARKWVHPLKDRPDIVIDSSGETWIVAPVSKNVGVFVPIFYRFTHCPAKPNRGQGVEPWHGRVTSGLPRHMGTQSVHKYRDDTPKTAKPTKR